MMPSNFLDKKLNMLHGAQLTCPYKLMSRRISARFSVKRFVQYNFKIGYD